MLPAIEIAPQDERDARFDAAAAQFAAPLARVAWALEDEPSRRWALLQDIHIALWRSLTQYDERIGLRTWVFRVAYNSVATHQPNSHEQASRQDTISQAWKRRSSVRKQCSLDEAEAATGSAVGFVQGLKAFDRALACLYLEGLATQDAVAISGLPEASLQAVWQRLAKLLPMKAVDEWQKNGNEITPMPRVLVHSRIGDLRTRRIRIGWGQLILVAALTAAFVTQAMLSSKPRWLATAGLVVLAIMAIIDAWKMRRLELASEDSPETIFRGTLDLWAFHRRLLERERDKLREGWGFSGWGVLLALGLMVTSSPLERGSGWTWPAVVIAGLIIVGMVNRVTSRMKANQLQARIAATP